MAQSDKGAKGKKESAKQPFVAQEDRPEVRIDPDTPVSELRVRDLSAILGLGTKSAFESPLKAFFDKPFPEVVKDFVKELKVEKVEKPEKNEKFEKNEKLEKNEKHEKNEKLEKREVKDLKAEKVEHDGVFDPGKEIGPDPRLEQVIQAVSGLSQQVGQLANQLEELRKKVSG